jgi:hypothetical protein
VSNPFLRFIELKKLEAQIKKDMPIAKQEAIAYYTAKPVLTGEKSTGQFSEVEGEKLPAKLVWKLIPTKLDNPVYAEKMARLAEIENSLKVINAEKLAEIRAQIAMLNDAISSYLVNEETEKIKAELKEIPPSIEGKATEELSVTLPK